MKQADKWRKEVAEKRKELFGDDPMKKKYMSLREITENNRVRKLREDREIKDAKTFLEGK